VLRAACAAKGKGFVENAARRGARNIRPTLVEQGEKRFNGHSRAGCASVEHSECTLPVSPSSETSRHRWIRFRRPDATSLARSCDEAHRTSGATELAVFILASFSLYNTFIDR
jgi:hypothetical protein